MVGRAGSRAGSALFSRKFHNSQKVTYKVCPCCAERGQRGSLFVFQKWCKVCPAHASSQGRLHFSLATKLVLFNNSIRHGAVRILGKSLISRSSDPQLTLPENSATTSAEGLKSAWAAGAPAVKFKTGHPVFDHKKRRPRSQTRYCHTHFSKAGLSCLPVFRRRRTWTLSELMSWEYKLFRRC